MPTLHVQAVSCGMLVLVIILQSEGHIGEFSPLQDTTSRAREEGTKELMSLCMLQELIRSWCWSVAECPSSQLIVVGQRKPGQEPNHG